MSSKQNRIWAAIQFFCPYSYEYNETRHHLTKKTSKSPYPWPDQFWNTIANVTVKAQNEEISGQNLTHR